LKSQKLLAHHVASEGFPAEKGNEGGGEGGEGGGGLFIQILPCKHLCRDMMFNL